MYICKYKVRSKATVVVKIGRDPYIPPPLGKDRPGPSVQHFSFLEDEFLVQMSSKGLRQKSVRKVSFSSKGFVASAWNQFFEGHIVPWFEKVKIQSHPREVAVLETLGK